MIGISNSEMATWTRCPRMWMVKYYYGLVPADPRPVGNMQLGSRVHTALEGLYGYDLDPLAVLKVLYENELERRPDAEDALRKEWDLAHAMVQGLMEWVISEGKDADWRVLSTEMELAVPLPRVEGVYLRGQLDLVERQVSTGHLKFRDWKTADSFEDHSIMELDTQFPLYTIMLHLRAGTRPGDDPQGKDIPMGGRITTLRRVKRTERAKPPFYQTDPVNYNPEQLDSKLRWAQQICREIMSARQSLDWASPQDMATFNNIQRTVTRPVPIKRDCSWRCELSSGGCVAMDDGSDWVGMLFRSGRWVQGDPYAYYEQRGIRAIKDQIAHLHGTGSGNLTTEA